MMAVAGVNLQAVGVDDSAFRHGERHQHTVYFRVTVAPHRRHRSEIHECAEEIRHTFGTISSGKRIAGAVVEKVSEQDNPVRLQLAHAVREKNEAVRSAVQIGTDDHPHERFSFTRVPASQEARSMASSMSMTGISSRMG